MDRLPTANGSLIQPFRPARGNLRMNGHGRHRLHRAGKAQVLAETKHGFHAACGVGCKINTGQQLAAVGRRLFYCG